MIERNKSLDTTIWVAEIVAAYVSNHQITPSELSSFIQLVHQSLYRLSASQSFMLSSPSEPAVPIEESIQPDYVICLEDGRKLKMLKRHLKTAYNMTPNQYRERWSLPANYPMVAPNYANQRRGIAKNIGLGTHRKRQKKVA